MRIFLDECVVVAFRHELAGLNVETAKMAGLLRLKNGALMSALAGRFDVIVTTDRGLPFQQNVPTLPFAIVVLQAKSNKIEDLRPLVPTLLATLRSIKAGQAYTVSLA